eukprot:TRINITY_DN8446_c0_g1_i2.p1 TRINITY_DN8446_c0_g1~~TRINITY_DN8446_c0_g1_i2.p1  ORF type:complete len:112 (-),score=9.81 TRINITY_DN8446_c0_g1_i2:1095-1430(-)
MKCHSSTAEFQEFFFFLNGQILQERSAGSLAGEVRHFSSSHPNGPWNLGSALVGRLDNQKANIQSYYLFDRVITMASTLPASTRASTHARPGNLMSLTSRASSPRHTFLIH